MVVMMNNVQIAQILSTSTVTKAHYRACVSVDQLSTISHRFIYGRRNIFIVNSSSDSAERFGHWLLLYFFPDNHCVFFDSFGNGPDRFNHHLFEFIHKFAEHKILSNRRQLQQSGSDLFSAAKLRLRTGLLQGEPKLCYMVIE